MQQNTQRPGKLDSLSDIDRIKYFPLSERLIAIRHNRHISAFQRGLDIEFCTNRIDYAGLSDVRIGIPTRIRIIF